VPEFTCGSAPVRLALLHLVAELPVLSITSDDLATVLDTVQLDDAFERLAPALLLLTLRTIRSSTSGDLGRVEASAGYWALAEFVGRCLPDELGYLGERLRADDQHLAGSRLVDAPAGALRGAIWEFRCADGQPLREISGDATSSGGGGGGPADFHSTRNREDQTWPFAT